MLPPLRERLEDLPDLAAQFIERFYREETGTGVRVRGIRPDALRALVAYPWPGNIRELRNVVWEALVYKRTGEERPPAGSLQAPSTFARRSTPSSAPR